MSAVITLVAADFAIIKVVITLIEADFASMKRRGVLAVVSLIAANCAMIGMTLIAAELAVMRRAVSDDGCR